MQNLVFKGLNGEFKIVAATQYITRIKDSTNKSNNIALNMKQLVFTLNFKIISYAVGKIVVCLLALFSLRLESLSLVFLKVQFLGSFSFFVVYHTFEQSNL